MRGAVRVAPSLRGSRTQRRHPAPPVGRGGWERARVCGDRCMAWREPSVWREEMGRELFLVLSVSARL